MNRKQVKHNLKAMEFWGNGGNLWFYRDGGWFIYTLDDIPFTSTERTHFIIEDKHFEARKAFALGMPIEISLNGNQPWQRSTSPSWREYNEYQPKPNEWFDNIHKPVLCWVWNNNSTIGKQPKEIVKYCEQHNTFLSNTPLVWWHNAEPIKPEECYYGEK